MKVGTLIIGSGVAATVLAETLLRAKPDASVLILEAGTRVKTKDFGIWENYLITGQLPYDAYKDLAYPQRDIPGENGKLGQDELPLAGARLFAYGGTTHHWGGWSFRLKPEDFYLKSNTNEGLDWPFDYNALEPFYCRAEQHLAVSGDSRDATVHRSADFPFRPFPFTLEDKPFADAFDKLGYGYAPMPIARRGVSATPSRHAPCQTTGTCKYCPFGARYIASNYLDELRDWNDYPGLRVAMGAVVTTLRLDGLRRIRGATYWDRNTGEMTDVDADLVVLACGAIEGAKLLQRSTSPDWPEGVGNAHKQVGRYLITHPYFMFKAKLPGSADQLQQEMSFPTLVSRHFDTEAEQKKNGKFILVPPADKGISFSITDEMKKGTSRDDIDKKLKGPIPIQLHGMVEVYGRDANRVDNSKDLNRVGLPQTLVTFTKDGGFDARMGEIRNHVLDIFNAMGATDIEPGVGNPSWRADHAASVTRMSIKEEEGVVDPDLRVHGIDNLYVISNGVFPNLGAVNPTLTLTALAYRLGDHLVARGVPA